jgi:2-iminobutanoate/2-iminopropanoate deaminase
MKRFVPLVAVSLVVCSPICVAQKKVITTPDAISGAPLSPAIQAGNMVFVSGQLAYDPKTKQVKSDAGIEDQTRLALDNIKAILAAAGLGMENVVSTTVYMKDLKDFTKMNAVYATYFKEAPPARATIQAAGLVRDAQIEISAIAVK